jgi:putative membrane protein
MMWGYEGGYGWHWGFGMLLQMALYWGVLILLIVLLVRWIFGKQSGPVPRAPDKSALDILKERYARGEIGKDEFDQKKRDISE